MTGTRRDSRFKCSRNRQHLEPEFFAEQQAQPVRERIVPIDNNRSDNRVASLFHESNCKHQSGGHVERPRSLRNPRDTVSERSRAGGLSFRAKPVALSGKERAVPRHVPLPHLVALKLYAGGTKSLADIVELLSRNPDADVAAIRDLCQRWRLRGLDPLIEEAMGES